MDEPYASPDSDGHASLPSPTDTTFNMSNLPIKRRARPATSGPESIDSTAQSSDGDEDLTAGTLKQPEQVVLISSPPTLRRTRSNVLAPTTTTTNNSDTSSTTVRRSSRVIPGHESLEENIDPNTSTKNSRRPSPTLLKPTAWESTDEEADEGQRKPQIANRLDSGSEKTVGADERNTPTTKGENQLPNTSIMLRSTPDPHTGLTKRITVRKNRISPTRNAPLPPPAQEPPGEGDPNSRPEYLGWMSSDSIDDADDEYAPTDHLLRLNKAQLDQSADESGFSHMGGDEASYRVLNGFDDQDETFDGDLLALSNGLQKKLDFGQHQEVPGASLPSYPTSPESEDRSQGTLKRLKVVDRTAPNFNIDLSTSSESSICTKGFASEKSSPFPNPAQMTLKRKYQQPTIESYYSTETDDKSKLPDDRATIIETVIFGDHSASSTPTASLMEALRSSNTADKTAAIIAEVEVGSSSSASTVKHHKGVTPSFTIDSGPGSLSTGTTVKHSSSPVKYSPENGDLSASEDNPNVVLVEKSATQSEDAIDANQQKPLSAPTKTQLKPETSTGGGLLTTPGNNNHNNSMRDGYPYSVPPMAHSTPINIFKLKQSGFVRRMSMNTPPSISSMSTSEIFNHDPAFSSLGSGFEFPTQPVRYEHWDPTGVPFEFSPNFPLDAPAGRRNGVGAPPNSINNTPVPVDGKGRARSQSDPVEKKKTSLEASTAQYNGRMLFAATQIAKKQLEESPSTKRSPIIRGEIGKSRFPSPRGAPAGIRPHSPISIEDHDRDASDDGNDRRLWSGFTGDYRRESYAHIEDNDDLRSLGSHHQSDNDASPSRSVFNKHEHMSSLGHVDFRVQTPTSVGRNDSNIFNKAHDDSGVSTASNKTLWIRLAETEAANARLRKILETNNINLGDENEDGDGLKSHLIVPNSTSRQSTQSSAYVSAPDGIVSELRQHLAEVEDVVKDLREQEKKHQQEIEERNKMVEAWQERYNESQSYQQETEERMRTLKQKARRSEELRYEQTHKQGLDHRLEFYQQQAQEVEEAHRRDIEERDRTISHLRQSLEDKPDMLEYSDNVSVHPQGLEELVHQLRGRLREAEIRHQTDADDREAKFALLLEEKDALVKHLQAELDEMVNLMPVDHGSSRLIEEEEEADEWYEERSREMSQYIDDSLDHIITELQGQGGREDFDDAAEEAEMSLRKVAEDAGIKHPIDKVSLAAFGIRNMRAENHMMQKLLSESEARFSGLMSANEEFGKNLGEKEDIIRKLREQNEGLKCEIAGKEERIRVLVEEMDGWRTKIMEVEAKSGVISAEMEELRVKTQKTSEELNQRAKTLEDEKSALQQLVDETKREWETLKDLSAAEEERVATFEKDIIVLKRQISESRDHLSGFEAERVDLTQQITDSKRNTAVIEEERDLLKKELSEMKQHLERDSTEMKKARQDTEALIDQKLVAETRLSELQAHMSDLENHHETSGSKVRQLEERLVESDLRAQTLGSEKEAVKREVERLENEYKSARSRFNKLLHEVNEKETQWIRINTDLGAKLSAADQGVCALSKGYDKALARILAEIDENACDRADEDTVISLVHDAKMEGLPRPEVVVAAVVGIRATYAAHEALEKKFGEVEDKSGRMRAALKRDKAKAEKLAEENRELNLRLRAEKKSSDEKISQLILALRR